MAVTVTSKPAGLNYGNQVKLIECSDIKVNPYDLYIICGKTMFLVCKKVICDACPVLRDLLQEWRPEYIWQLDFGAFPEDICEVFLHYVYHKQVSVFRSMTPDMLLGLLKISLWLRMTTEINIIFRELLKTNDRAIIYLVWDLAFEFRNKVVKQLVVNCIYDNLKTLINSHFFIQVRWELLKALLTSSNAIKETSVDLAEAAIQWVKWDIEHRQDHLAYIAYHINWRKMDQDTLAKLFKTEPLLRTLMELSVNEKHRMELKKSSRAVSVGVRKPLPTLVQQTAFQPTDIVHYPFRRGMLLIGQDDKFNFIIKIYHPDVRSWTVKLDVQMPFRSHYSSIFIKKRLYVVGGGDAWNYKYVKCFAYDIPQNQPFEFEDLKVPRSHAGMISDDESIYVIGGLDLRGKPTNSVERMNVIAVSHCPPEWIDIPGLKHARWHPGVAVNDAGDIYVFGGHTSTCECYDKKMRRWIRIPSLPKRYDNCEMFSVQCSDGFYSFRRSDPREVCIYDPDRNTMKVIPVGGNVPKELLGLIVFDSTIWALAKNRYFYIYQDSYFLWKQVQITVPEDMIAVFNLMNVEADIGIRLAYIHK